MADIPPQKLTDHEFQQLIEVLRKLVFGTVVLPPAEHWKLKVWERENPALVRPPPKSETE